MTLACLLPFVGKAFHSDDPLFVWTARHILGHPLDFYGFTVNWYGFEMPMAEVMKNPPLVAYYLAATAGWLGLREWSVHLALLVPAVAAALGTHALARRFSARPVLAALVGILTPAFVVCGTTAMADVSLLAFWVWAVERWIAGLDAESRPPVLLAALLATLAVLTKYSGVCIFPLLWLYALLQRRPWRLVAEGMAVPVLVLAAYEAGTWRLYRQGLLFGSAKYVADVYAIDQGSAVATVLTGLSFMGGCFLLSALFAPFTWRWWEWALAAVALPAVAAVALRLEPMRSFLEPNDVSWARVAELLGFVLAGAHGMRLVARELRTRSPDGVFLGAWILGVFVFTCGFNWTVNARSLLPMMPPLAILTVRELESLAWFPRPEATWRIAGVVAAGATVALAVAWADYAQARSPREAARRIVATHGASAPAVYFQGHWGFQLHMQDAGALPVDIRKWDAIPVGAVIAVPLRNTNTERPENEHAYPVVERLAIPSSRGISTLDPAVSAGFYASVFGILPYTIGPATLDRYFVARKISP